MPLHPLRSFQEQVYAPVDGVGFVHDPEGPANHQDEHDDGGCAFKALEEGREDLPRLRLAIYMVVGVVHDDAAFVAIHVNDLAVELTAGDYPSKNRTRYNDGKDDCKRVRYFKVRTHGEQI